MNTRLNAGMVTLFLTLSVSTSQAVEEYTTMTVSLNKVSTATLAATNMDFGDQLGSSTATAGSTITVTLPTGTSYQIGLDAGQNLSANLNRQLIHSGGDEIEYALYNDSSLTTRWGDQCIGALNTLWEDCVSGNSTGSPVTHTVYGGTLSNFTSVGDGAYSDVVRVTLLY